MAKDILMDESGDLLIRNGDLVVDTGDEQHIQDILLSDRGQWIDAPLIGVSVIDYLHAPNDIRSRMALQKRIMLQLNSDKATKVDVQFTPEGALDIQATYD